jgi:hypothetical protein
METHKGREVKLHIFSVAELDRATVSFTLRRLIPEPGTHWIGDAGSGAVVTGKIPAEN